MPMNDFSDSGVPFTHHDGTAGRRGPVVLSVPHAGRAYPAWVGDRARIAPARLRQLEDRHADALISPLVDAGAPALIAHVPRALIDLNRDERDIDRRAVRDMPHGWPVIESAKQRGGLGLFPRTLPHVGDIWAGPTGWDDARARIAQVHRPYHAKLAEMMDITCAERGVGVILDIHSMPPLDPARHEGHPPDIVIGDRFGTSCDPRLSSIALAVAAGHGLNAALNHPYAGSYLIERHSDPVRARHAMQVEVSRALYLDAGFDRTVAAGLERVQRFLCALFDALHIELDDRGTALAAE